MNREEATALVRRIYEDAFNGHDPALFDELFAEDYVDYSVGYGGPLDRDGAKWALADYIRAFPDARWTFEDLLVDGNRLAWRETFTGTHGQELHSIPPTGRKVRAEGISMAELREGKVWRHWSIYDSLGILQQIGGVQIGPPPAPAPAG
jgi:predicted ester cyclase